MTLDLRQGFTLVLSNKAYSSWSMRPWLAARATGQPFEEIVIPLRQPDTRQRILAHAPNGKVPILKAGPHVIWESLAFIEALADAFPDAGLWPADPVARAQARAISAEMHAGFPNLRRELPVDLKTPPAPIEMSAEAEAEIERVFEVWRRARAAHGEGGPYLFGRFTAADAMYAPVVTRFVTYAVPFPDDLSGYAKAVLAHPDMVAWAEAGRAEPWTITFR